MPNTQTNKVPILTGINDTPSQTGDAKHPNASLLCNKYNALIDAIDAFTSDDLAEGTTNKYYTDARFDTRLATKSTDNLAEGTTNKYYASSLANADFDTRLATKSTDNLTEGATNLYHTSARARASISVTGNGTYDSGTGVINISNATISVDHVTKTNTNGLIDTYTLWGDQAETITVGTFTVTNGADGVDGADGTNGTNGTDGQDIDHVALTNTVGLTKTYTVWGDAGETINLGTFTVVDGTDGVDGADGATGATGSVSAATALELLEQSSSPTEQSGKILVYAKDNNKLYFKPDTATEYEVDTVDANTIKKNVTNTFTKAQVVATVALSDGANIAVDASLGNVFSVTLGGNRTFDNPTNLVSGQTFIFKVKQDATGSRTVTWSSAYRFPSGTAPTLSTAANKLDIVSCVSDGTNLYCNFVGGY